MNKKARICLIVSLCLIATLAAAYFIAFGIHKAGLERDYPADAVNYSGMTVAERFTVPEGYERVNYPEGTGAFELQHLNLKKFGLAVYDSEGRRVKRAPIWGVALYDGTDSEVLDKYGLNTFADPHLYSFVTLSQIENGAVRDIGEVRPGCLCIRGSGDISVVLDVCRNADGDVKVITAALNNAMDRTFGVEMYVENGPEGSRTPWISAEGSGISFFEIVS